MVAAPDREASAIKASADEKTRTGNFHDAVPLYSQALQIVQDAQLRSTLLANRCLALLKTQQPANALDDALKSLQLRPRWHKAHLRVAQCQEALSDIPAAIASYKRALELDPSLKESVGKALAALELKDSREQCRLSLKGHSALYDMALHPQVLVLGALSTRILATACADGTLRVWCTTTGTLLQTLTGHTDMVTTLEWSPCGLVLASGSLDNTARLWELAPGLAQQISPSAAAGVCCAGTKPSTGFLSGLHAQQQQKPDGGADVAVLQLRAMLEGHSARVSSLAFSTRALHMAACPSAAAAQKTSSEAETSAAAAPTKGGATQGASSDTQAYSTGAASAGGATGSSGRSPSSLPPPEGMVLATGSTDCTARLWSVESGESLQVLKGHGGLITSVSISPCCRLLATASGDTRCKVWNMATGVCMHDIAWESGGVNLCGFLPQPLPPPLPAGAPLGSASSPQPSAGELRIQEDLTPPLLLTAHIEPRRREGRVLLWDVGAGDEEYYSSWLAPTSVPVSKKDGQAAAEEVGVGAGGVPSGVKQPPAPGEEGDDCAAAASCDGLHTEGSRALAGGATAAAAVGDTDACAEVVAAAVAAHGEGKPKSDSAGGAGKVAAVREEVGAPPKCPGRKKIGWVDGQLHAPVQTIDGFRGKITSWDACVGPGGAVLLAAACGDGLARVYDVTSGVVPLFELSMEHGMLSAAQHDMPTWSLASMQHAANSRNLVRFSPGGERLAVSGGDYRITIYDVESSQPLQCMLGHSKSIRALLWASEGELVSGGEDGAVKFWRVAGAS